MITQRYRLKQVYKINYAGIFILVIPYMLIFFYFLYPTLTNSILIVFIFLGLFLTYFFFLAGMQAMKERENYSTYLTKIWSLKIFEDFNVSLDKNFKTFFYSAIDEQMNKIDSDDLFREVRDKTKELYSFSSIKLPSELRDLEKFLEENKKLCAENNKQNLLSKYIRAIETVFYTQPTFKDEAYEDSDEQYYEISLYEKSRDKTILLIDSSIIRKKLILWYETHFIRFTFKCDGLFPETNFLIFLEFISCSDEASIDYYINLTSRYIRNNLKLISETYTEIMNEYENILDLNKKF